MSLEGDAAPLFEALGPDGEAASPDDFGFPVLLIFVSPGCSSCLNALGEVGYDFPNTHVLLIAIADSHGLSSDQKTAVASVADQYENVSWLTVQDPVVINAYRVAKSPTYFAVDNAGMIVGVHEGPASEDELRTLVIRLLGAG